MAQPIFWSKQPFFYPIGNTTPVSLTQALSPEEDGLLLLLGCGDIRNILYTVHADVGNDDRRLDFTCCDAEPAVLARNVLLYSMITDDVSITDAWRIYYHIYLDGETLQVLMSQCRKLLQCCTDPETWKTSQYGAYMRFCTEHTLEEIRRHLQLYLDLDLLPAQEKDALKASFASEMKAIRNQSSGLTLNGVRAGGPLGKSPGILETERAFSLYWSKGTTTGKSDNNVTSPKLNPTFVYSQAGRVFNVHHGTSPIHAFHLAPALTRIKGVPSNQKVVSEDLVETAKRQFDEWVHSFKNRIANGSTLVIRFFIGDCLALCRALQVCKTSNTVDTGVYAFNWGSKRVVFNADYSNSSTPRAPLSFNVIDTSNLSDHVGLLNILILAVPLLERKPWAMLHTCTLIQPSSGGHNSSLSGKVFADLPTISLFLGISPISNLYHLTTQSDKHGILAAKLFRGQFQDAVAWRFPSIVTAPLPNSDLLNTRLLCDERQLGTFFFSLYLQMFADENFQAPGMDALERRDLILYTRASFVALLALVKQRVEVDWNLTMYHFTAHVEMDRSLVMGPNFYQELVCQLFLQAVYTQDTLREDFIEQIRVPDDFRGWVDVPPVVCVTFVVPRQHLRALEKMGRKEIGSPILQCETRGAKGHNIHPNIRPTFGEVLVSHIDGEPLITIKEDPLGWNGESSLVVTFDVPAWVLTKYAQLNKIGLYVRSTPGNVSTLMPKLGRDLAIYTTPLRNESQVYFSRKRPNEISNVSPVHESSSPPKSTADKASVIFNSSGSKVTTLSIRHDIEDPEAVKSLSSGAIVTNKTVADAAILVSYQGYERLFSYPFPILGSRSKIKIARKSAYIEVESPIRPGFSSFSDVSQDLFPITMNDSSPRLLNIHYLNLEALPTLQIPMPSSDLQWLSSHLGMMMSEREQQMQRSSRKAEDNGMIINLKESIGTFFLKSSGFDRPSTRVIGVSNPTLGLYILVFVNEIRLDLSCHTVVADACVIPLTLKNGAKVQRAMQKSALNGLMETVTQDDEMQAWRSLLPAFVERCRTWKHTSECEYQLGGPPVGRMDPMVSPLCSCGKGKDLGAFGNDDKWRELHAEATRAAISPLFSFSCMEDTEKSMMDQSIAASTKACAMCGGPGQPTLLVCGACKSVKYCSSKCQKANWKAHRPNCTR